MSLPAAVQRSTEASPIKVMVVDDSVVVRGLLSRWIDAEAEMTVVSAHRNGKLAVDDVLRSDPDIIVLDIEMPEMDGITALPLLLKAKPRLNVIVASTLTRRNAEISMRCLKLGAKDFVPKPETNSAITTSASFKRELLDKIKALSSKGFGTSKPAPAASSARASTPMPAATPAAAPRSASFDLRGYSSVPPRLVMIGSSTGGPEALAELMRALAPAIARVPVVITQHMPPTFTTLLAENLARETARPCAEGKNGDSLKPGHIYVAPGGKHMLFESRPEGTLIRLDDGPQVNFCKPAVDPMFESAVGVYGSAILSVILTGMGSDGANGVRKVASAGGSVIAQDEATSVVWGMPGAAAKTGMCSDVLSIKEIGPKMVKILSGGRV